MALNDVGGSVDSSIPRPFTYVVTAFLSVAFYNVLELTFLLFYTFKRRHGLYFWSVLVATWGIAIYSIGFVLKDFKFATDIPAFYVTLIIFGWCCMVSGQSLVLYSRLHLVVRRHAILRFVLTMIVVNAIILHIPTIILCYGANSVQHARFAGPYAIYERIQVTIFFVQEVIISGLYLYTMCRLLYFGGTLSEVHGEAGRRLILHLIYMNITVIILDVTIIVLQLTGRYVLQTAIKATIYSVKLKLEFNILNRLVDLTRHAGEGISSMDYGHSSGFWSGSGDTQVEEGRGHHGAHRRAWRESCPWHVFPVRVKHEVAGPVVDR
ncbi:uncharacterized protein BJX67DRAFT_391450 [Aspergillus lucknowensis]|uniref:DUF7703 domain-containing protein n=1 Tax=Aspergillus lucknowensis TaxID=176173 RepID=A0ABR4LCP6_9EURO